MRPKKSDYNPFFETYISLIKDEDVVNALISGQQKTQDFIKQIPAEKANYKYAEDKWTINEVIGHLIDCERIFSFRALSIARNDKTELSSFNENDYAAFFNADKRDIKDLIEELYAVRTSTILMFKSFEPSTFNIKGNVSGHPLTPLALGYICAGHEAHHLKVIQEKYL